MKAAPEPITVLRGHTDPVNCVSYISELLLSSGAGNGDLKLWDLGTRRPHRTVQAHDGSIISLSLITSSLLVSSGRDGFVRVWDCTSLLDTPIHQFQTGSRHFCNSVTDHLRIGAYYVRNFLQKYILFTSFSRHEYNS